VLKRALVSQDYRETNLFARNVFPIRSSKYDEEQVLISEFPQLEIHQYTE
jgi:hypothetical protein